MRKCKWCRHSEDCHLWKREDVCIIEYIDYKWHRDEYEKLNKKRKAEVDMRYERRRKYKSENNN